MPNPSECDRFMVKFLFTRMSEPHGPTWDYNDGTWITEGNDPPSLLCRRAWDWMRGTETASGFVPKTDDAPALGATNSGEFARARQTNPFFACRSA